MICCGIVAVANIWRSVKRRITTSGVRKIMAGHEPILCTFARKIARVAEVQIYVTP